MWRKGILGLGIGIGLVLAALAASIYAQLELPAPTGAFAVGRTTLSWVDTARPETQTAGANDLREVPVVVWYPAQPGTGAPTGYFPGLDKVASDLALSGEVEAVEVYGLRYIRSAERVDADPAEGSWPVRLLSPGNGTNVEFYDALAAELASQGYVVVGLNHPYDVAAVALSDGRVARFIEDVSLKGQASALLDSAAYPAN